MTTTPAVDTVEVPRLGRYQIDADSSRTGNGHRDRDVRSVRFLDTDQHPRMTFTSTGLHSPAGRHLDVSLRILAVRS